MRQRILLLLLTLGVIAAACTGGSDDDDDTGSPSPSPSESPSPSPSPTPFIPPDRCFITWQSTRPQGTTTVSDGWLIDVPVGLLTGGSTALVYGTTQGIVATVIHGQPTGEGFPLTNASPVSEGFTLIYDGLGEGDAVTFESTKLAALQRLTYDMDGNPSYSIVGSGGLGSFTGVWSPRTAEIPNMVLGSGLITATVQGTDLALGVTRSFAQCYDVTPEK